MHEPQAGPDAVFAAHLSAGRFMLQRCGACGRHVFRPRPYCPYCHADALAWHAASGRGTVYSCSTVRQRPDRGGDYNVSIVELDEGPRLMTRVEGVPPDAVTIGLRVTARIAEIDGRPALLFHPSPGA